MSIVISVDGLSKLYRLGAIGTRTLQADLRRWWAKAQGKPDPLLPIDAVERSASGEELWALKNVNVEVSRGEVLGIVGGNGAGKSTLLKVLARVTAPTAGRVRIRGRMASLLEVGTGFHPELTGRANIFLNGTLLGLRREEITNRFEEIVEFSGVGRHIDTPVKRYSSGMYVRLAFAVAAHLEPDILIVDEVLAVGDAEFQSKCLGKMDEAAKAGRTILFVSHNMAAVRRLCSRAILLEGGSIVCEGSPEDVIETYLRKEFQPQGQYRFLAHANGVCSVSSLVVENEHAEPSGRLPALRPWQIRVAFETREHLPYFVVGIGIMTADGVSLNTSWSPARTMPPGRHEAIFRQDMVHFSPGSYRLTVGLSSREQSLFYLENCASLEIEPFHDKSVIINTVSGVILNQMDCVIEDEP